MLVSKEEFEAHCEEYDGLCTACGAIQWGEVEPDAEGYQCDECNSESVMGFEQALLCGFVEIRG